MLADLTARCRPGTTGRQRTLTPQGCMGCRDLNAATSQEVFAGPYLGDAAQRARFSACFQDMTQGFLAFPLCFPGTAVWRARQGRLWILSVLRQGAAASKTAIKVCCHEPSEVKGSRADI